MRCVGGSEEINLRCPCSLDACNDTQMPYIPFPE